MPASSFWVTVPRLQRSVSYREGRFTCSTCRCPGSYVPLTCSMRRRPVSNYRHQAPRCRCTASSCRLTLSCCRFTSALFRSVSKSRLPFSGWRSQVSHVRCAAFCFRFPACVPLVSGFPIPASMFRNSGSKLQYSASSFLCLVSTFRVTVSSF